jgi:hypothetical protein
MQGTINFIFSNKNGRIKVKMILKVRVKRDIENKRQYGIKKSAVDLFISFKFKVL